jgi:hypothetical protein
MGSSRWWRYKAAAGKPSRPLPLARWTGRAAAATIKLLVKLHKLRFFLHFLFRLLPLPQIRGNQVQDAADQVQRPCHQNLNLEAML